MAVMVPLETLAPLLAAALEGNDGLPDLVSQISGMSIESDDSITNTDHDVAIESLRTELTEAHKAQALSWLLGGGSSPIEDDAPAAEPVIEDIADEVEEDTDDSEEDDNGGFLPDVKKGP